MDATITQTLLTGRSTLTSVPSSKDTRQVMMDFASPAAGMCVVARWASRNRLFSACFRMERRPSVLRRKLSMMGGLHFYTCKSRGWILKHVVVVVVLQTKCNVNLQVIYHEYLTTRHSCELASGPYLFALSYIISYS